MMSINRAIVIVFAKLVILSSLAAALDFQQSGVDTGNVVWRCIQQQLFCAF